MGLEDWTIDFNMSFFLGDIVKDVGNLSLITAFITKEGIRASIGLWLRERKSISKIDSMKRCKNVFLLRCISLHCHITFSASNIRIFDDESWI